MYIYRYIANRSICIIQQLASFQIIYFLNFMLKYHSHTPNSLLLLFLRVFYTERKQIRNSQGRNT